MKWRTLFKARDKREEDKKGRVILWGLKTKAVLNRGMKLAYGTLKKLQKLDC
jgi:hypothetical protein